MIRWLKSLFAWRAVRNTGCWIYAENTVTGQRSASLISSGFQPLDRDWLRDGDVVHGRRGTYVLGTESEIING